MKTIFISSFNPFILRNLLVGDMLKVLRSDSHSRVVVLVPDYKAQFFKDIVGADNILVEGVAAVVISNQDTLFRFINSSLVNISTIFVHRKAEFGKDKKFLRFLASLILMKIFSRSVFFKRLARQADYLTIDKKYLGGYFDKYKPDLVFATDLFNDSDVHLLAGAKLRNIKTAGMVRSWDNFTTKGIFRIKPDRTVVHNNILKQQAVSYCGVESETVFVSGIPQYDCYFRRKRMDRKVFFGKLGLDSSRKLILFSPLGQRFSDTDWQIMFILQGLIEAEVLPNLQLLVRLTPNDEVPLGDFKPGQYCRIDSPGHEFTPGTHRDHELKENDMEWLADCLYHSDVIVSGSASMAVDAAVFGKPSVLIYFDGFEEKPYHNSVKRFFGYSHGLGLIKTGSARAARSTEELKQHLVDYLRNPDLDAGARQAMVNEQCYQLDGRSGERLGEFLLSLLY